MNTVLSENHVQERALAGNKAATLARLMNAGFNVPPFFVVTMADGTGADSRFEDQVARAANRICPAGERFAVRSSSGEEDGKTLSFAGQFDTYLNIERQDILQFSAKVVGSVRSKHVDAYRSAAGIRNDGKPIAVLVQRMVNADAAGVAFAADPISGNPSVAVVAATKGTGDALVAGAEQGDAWRVDARGRILAQELQSERAVLPARQVRKVAKLVRRVSKFAGCPQDIEWAIEKGRIFLLQSRDITTLHEGPSVDSYALWDNSNIVESYGGVTTPLTFSVARTAYQEAYRHMGRALGVSERNITNNARAYEQMIGLIQGRVYYNLLNWYRLLMLTPGFRFNRKFMEQMMGVTAGLPHDAIPQPGDLGPFARLRASCGMLRVAQRLVRKMFMHRFRVSQFHREIDGALIPIDLSSMSLCQLIDRYEALQARVIPAWDTPLINDLYCMIFHGALRRLGERWFDESFSSIHNDLVSGESGIVSVEPVRRMRQLAEIAVADPGLVDALCDGKQEDIEKMISGNPAFRKIYDRYRVDFGDRCLDELKLESATLNDDPMPLLRGIGQLARSGRGHSSVSSSDELRTDAERRIDAALRNKPLRRFVYRFVLGLARARVRDRENLRFERTRVYGAVRRIFVEIGSRLSAMGAIRDVSDVFYLDVAEITAFIRGTGISARLAPIVDNRRMEFAEYRESAGPPRRFTTVGPAQFASSIRETVVEDINAANDQRQGQACSKGVVRGPVRVVRDPGSARIVQGDILVAERTDPGWVTLFPLVSGMIMERGSLLSHSAIVARELGIPAIVGVDNACSWLNDGDWIELDGATGVIRRIDAANLAA